MSLNHNGGKGALLAIIHLQDADRGYSETVNFANPSGKTTERHGAGLRLGSVNNDPLRAMIAVRNIGDSVTTVTATIPYSKRNGDTGKVSLPQVSLAPGAIELLDTSNPLLGRNDFDTAGLEIKYTGAPGSVIASASSVSRSGNHVFTLPMKDPQGGLSSTGGYPWFIRGSASTVVFIKNTTDEPRTFTINLVYDGGQWGSGLKTIAPGQTFKLDVREVRDSQMKGSEGNVMPLDAVSGHVSWSVRGKGGNKTLIGRAQTVDFSNGVASTYECQLCCPRSFYDSRLVPGAMNGFPGYQEQFLAQERTRDCHGNIWPWDGASGGTAFSSDDWSVADVTYGGLCTAIAPGSTTIRASWNSFSYFMDPDGFCLEEPVPTEPTADCNVQQPDFTISQAVNCKDGETANFSVNVTAGTATGYNWTFTTPSGSGNNPNPNFGSPNAANTSAKCRWFASPDRECPATNCVGTYTIRCEVTFEGGQRITRDTSLSVDGCWFPAGSVAPPNIAGGPTYGFDTQRNLWVVTGPGGLQRQVQSAVVNVPSTSQFRNKAVTHENRHVQQWTSGILSDLFTIQSLMTQLMPLTDASEAGLISKINSTSVTWFNNQGTIYQGRLSSVEKDAYDVSDPVAPKYLYQNCGRYQ